ncbi:hypothetical protein T265_01719 [Opisthorchis viverrini]|uniref:Uncharacterized protein n=1 Tax=Opisthorchis viverrini TaxID=6198 RepID=A0A074ZYD5_OPIVI|nr:hypothetical protein T265_01719 [Opisthorchis viverrini]KER32091.1 hypothetical protein T265_01719 [Opisthorchis viverrini]
MTASNTMLARQEENLLREYTNTSLPAEDMTQCHLSQFTKTEKDTRSIRTMFKYLLTQEQNGSENLPRRGTPNKNRVILSKGVELNALEQTAPTFEEDSVAIVIHIQCTVIFGSQRRWLEYEPEHRIVTANVDWSGNALDPHLKLH